MYKILLFLFTTLSFGVSSLSHAQDIDITILHTNDTHARGFSNNTIGYAKLAGYVNQLRNDNRYLLLLDAGDTLVGQPIAELSQGQASIQVMNQIGYDAMTPGNGDFVYGSQVILNLAKQARFPFISTNIYYQDQLAFQPYIIKNIAGINIAITGVSPLNSMLITTASRLQGFRVTDPIAELATLIPQLRQQADLVIVIAHLGKLDPEVNIQKLVEQVPGIDIIVDGHDHVALKTGQKINNTIIVNSGEYDQYLGELTLHLSDKTLISSRARLLSKEDLAAVPTAPDIEKQLQQLSEENIHYLKQVVANVPFPLEGSRNLVRSQQTNLGSIITDAERLYTQADIAMTVGAFLRQSIPAGELTREVLLKALPFSLPSVTRKMTGQQLIDFIEHSYQQPDLITPAFTHVSGLSFSVDFQQPVGKRLTNIQVNGQPIDLHALYTVACNEQISDFNIREIPIEQTFDITMADLLVDYLNTHPLLSEPTPRVTINR